MKCNHCGNLMVDAVTNFTMLKDGTVYVIENVPCLECPVCEQISFTQEVAGKLERYCSGRILPYRMANAWVYRWGTPIIEVTMMDKEASTENTPLSVSIRGTLGDEKTPRYPITIPSHT